jgi:hypothetical protein
VALGKGRILDGDGAVRIPAEHVLARRKPKSAARCRSADDGDLDDPSRDGAVDGVVDRRVGVRLQLDVTSVAPRRADDEPEPHRSRLDGRGHFPGTVAG